MLEKRLQAPAIPAKSLRDLLFWLLCVASALTAPLAAQNVAATLNGTVRDSSGAVIVNAAVTLINDASGASRTLHTNADGYFAFTDTLVGSYSLAVSMPGFKSYRQRDIKLTAGQVRALGDITMTLGEVAETVTVEASAAPVELGSGEKAGVITQDDLQNTAIRGRDFLDMARLLPGVVDETEGRETPGPNGISGIYINGGRDDQKNVTVDGVTSMNSGNNTVTHIAPTINIIAEVKVLTSNYQAEFGRAAGGTIIVTTRGGGKQYHGSGIWSHRHEQFNANNFFSNQKGLQRPPYRYNLAGWNLGGPVWPKNRREAKFFFFVSQEYMRQKINYNPQSVRMPTELERQGDFTQTLDTNRNRITIYDPAVTMPFPGNIIPKDRQNKIGQAILNMFPLPNYMDPVPSRAVQWNYIVQVAGSYPRRQDMFRLDFASGSRWQAYLRYIQDTDEQHPYYGTFGATANYNLTPMTLKQPGKGATLNVSRPIGASWFNQLILGFSMNRTVVFPDQPEKVSRKDLGINLPQWRPQLNPRGYIPNMSFGTPGTAPSPTMHTPMPYQTFNPVLSLTENLSKIHGTHTIRTGIYIERTRKDQLVGTPTRGTLSFSDDSNNPLRTRYGFASALMGIMTTYTEATSAPFGRYLFTNCEWYIQDNWKVNRRLALDYGIRFYHDPAQTERRHQLAAFVPSLYDRAKSVVLITSGRNEKGVRIGVNPVNGQQFNAAFVGTFAPGFGDPANGMVTSAIKGWPDSLYTVPAVMFGPRFGFAFDPFGKGRTALRGGFGVFFDRISGNPTMNMVVNPPTSYSPTLYYATFDDLAASANSALLAPSSGTSLYGKGTMPQSYQWSFGIQQALARSTRFEVSYVGNVGRHLLWYRNINPVPIGAQFLNLHPENRDPTTGSAYSSNFLRPYIGYSDIYALEFAATSNYNSLQNAFSTRLKGGLEMRTSYTFAKTLGTAATYGTQVTPFFAPRVWNYGPLSYSRAHVMTMTPNWRVPRNVLREHRILRASVQNWLLYVTAQFSTGQPYRPGFGTSDGQNFTGTPSQSANMIWLGGTSFARPCMPRASGAVESPCWGNAGPGILTRPGINNFDARLTRRFNLFSEQRTLDLRVEAFNVFNHTQFSGIDTTARFDPQGNQINAVFLEPTSARRPRVLNLGIQVNF